MDFFNQVAKTAFKQFAEVQKQMNKIFDDLNSSNLSMKMNEGWEELKQMVKNLTDKFIVSVPFDRERENLNFSIQNDKIIVRTSIKSDEIQSVSTTETTIPTGIDVNRMIQKYDEKHKKMLFIFFKKFSSKDTNKEKLSKDEMIQRMIQLHNEGESYPSIGKKFGVNPKTVAKWVRENLKK